MSPRSAVLVLALLLICGSLSAQEKLRTFRSVTGTIDSAKAARLVGKLHFKTDPEIDAAWSQLRKGMSFEQVDSLLGTPQSRDFAVDRSVCYWRYRRGELRFNNTAETLTAWDK